MLSVPFITILSKAFSSTQNIQSNCDIQWRLRIKRKMFVVCWEWIQAPACSLIEPVLLLFMRERKHITWEPALARFILLSLFTACRTDSSRQGIGSHSWIINTPLSLLGPWCRQKKVSFRITKSKVRLKTLAVLKCTISCEQKAFLLI